MALIGYARVSTEEQQTDSQVVVRIDRLARSLSHLLEVIERLRPAARISAASAIRSTPRARRASSPCKCSGPRPSTRPAGC